MKDRILLIGPQGSGKSTQAVFLSQHFGVPNISTGDIFRKLSSEDSEPARKVKEILASGRLVDDETTAQIVKERLAEEDCQNGFVIDGYPRSIRQIEIFDPGFNKVFYLAVPSQFFEAIVDNLKKSNLATGSSRIVFEKPFGHDLKSSMKLNKTIKKAFKENQIYRLDHYLGKELVQNLLVLRFANNIFDPVWSKKYIDHVQITVAEDIGVETRGNYYDNAGALRDIIQNHMMQLVALTAMEPPRSLNADDIRTEKVKVLSSIKPFASKNVKNIAVRGQYGSGVVNNKEVKAYRDEEKVDKKSNTETFVALKLNIGNNRWKGVPFYLRTGKRLNERVAEINIVFKQTSCILFCDQIKNIEPNMLIVRIQPEEGISLQFSAKVPGQKMTIDTVRMDFCHECKFGPKSPEAYERLLYDIISRDQTLFTRWDEVEIAWKIVDRIAKAWKKGKVINYNAGSWGPKEADILIERDGRKWYKPQSPIYSSLLQNSSKI